MTVLKIVSGAIAGTSLMTIFSYLISALTNKQFREPVLLNELFNRSQVSGFASSKVFGWILHYMIGVSFLVIFHFVWKLSVLEVSYLSGTLLGFAGGFAGIVGWFLTFRIHSNPPDIVFPVFYLHLLAAHIIFGWGAVAGYRLF